VLKEFRIENGKLTTFSNVKQDYTIKIIAFNSSVLYEKQFDISFIIVPSSNNDEQVIQLEKKFVFLRLPFDPHAEKIQMYHNNTLIFDLNVKNYLCNRDNICSWVEDEVNCPEDCGQTGLVYVIILLLIPLIYITYKWLKTRELSKNKDEVFA
jgi:hypothetical protein